MLRYFSLAFGILNAKYEKVLGINEKDKRAVATRPFYDRRLISLGIVLLGKPDMIFWDEPFEGLDV